MMLPSGRNPGSIGGPLKVLSPAREASNDWSNGAQVPSLGDLAGQRSAPGTDRVESRRDLPAMRRLPWSCHLDPDPAHAMSAPKIPDGTQAALGLLGVIVCTKAFTAATRRMGWSALAVTAAMFLAGHLASRW